MSESLAFTPEVLFSAISIIFAAGGLFTLLKIVEGKTKEHAKDLQNIIIQQYGVITQQGIHQEKINKIDEKLNKVEIQIEQKTEKMSLQIEQKIAKVEHLNCEILKILTKKLEVL